MSTAPHQGPRTASPAPLGPLLPPDAPPTGGSGRQEPADAVRQAVLGVPGISALDAGPFGTVATYLPGRRVNGVALREDGSAEVAVVVHVGEGLATDLPAVATAVRGVVRPWAPGAIHVIVADLDVPAP